MMKRYKTNFLPFFSLKKRFFFCFFLIFSYFSAISQSNNQVFLDRFDVDSSQKKQLFLEIDYFSFFKNNEYFNKILDGYTLFGNHFRPVLVYFPTENVRVSAGIFLWKDFGNANYSQIQPFLNIKYKKNAFSMIFGNLEGNLAHKLIEPLYDFERIINYRQEQGLQFKYEKKRLETEIWVNWQKMMYRFSNYQEEITGGFRLNYELLQKKNFKISLPFQLTALHFGGQLDTLSTPLTTIANVATGINFIWKSSKKSFLQSVRSDHYFLFYKDASFDKKRIFDKGKGIYLNLNFQTRAGELMFSYWQSDQYTSLQGGGLYNSESKSVSNIGGYEKERKLLIIRLMKDWEIAKNLFFTFRAEPHYDFLSSTFEYNYAFYVKYFQNFKLLNVK